MRYAAFYGPASMEYNEQAINIICIINNKTSRPMTTPSSIWPALIRSVHSSSIPTLGS